MSNYSSTSLSQPPKPSNLKISDLKLDGFDYVTASINHSLITNIYFLGPHTLSISYHKETTLITSLSLNDYSIPLDNPAIFKLLSAFLNTYNKPTQEEPVLTIAALNLFFYPCTCKTKAHGLCENTYIIEETKITVTYYQDTGVVHSLKVNGNPLILSNNESIFTFNHILKKHLTQNKK